MVKRIIPPGRDKLVRNLKTLTSSVVKVGYFDDQGKHSSGMNYPTLMWLHEVHGVRSRNGIVKRRPFELTMMSKQKELFSTLRQQLAMSIGRLAPPDNALATFGHNTVKEIQTVFGDTGLLESNAPATIKRKGFNAPLIETSELKNHLTFRIKKKGD